MLERKRAPINLCFCIHLRFYRSPRCWGVELDFQENRMSMDSREQMAPPWL